MKDEESTAVATATLMNQGDMEAALALFFRFKLSVEHLRIVGRARQAAGLCPACGGEPAGGRVLCRGCLDRRARSARARRASRRAVLP